MSMRHLAGLAPFCLAAGFASGACVTIAPPVAKLEEHIPVWTGDQVLGYHRIRTDAQGMMLPWSSDDPATAYDHVVRLVWGFWDGMAVDRNGLPYYMNHQVWRPRLDDHRGIGGDQIQMALSSWALLYQYMGNFENRAHDRIVENMKFMADWYLSHSLSSTSAQWPNIPYPYNTLIYSGVYDGDMVIGHGYTQPDKAGSLGAELVTLYKITGNERYLQAAVDIADTLANHTQAGDQNHSPLPFKVHAQTGKLGQLAPSKGQLQPQLSNYTSNWSGTLELWSGLVKLRAQQHESALMATGHSTQAVELSDEQVAAYNQAFATVLAWMKAYPCKTNKWGPFFEDVWGWSDTQINAVTFADYIMNHTDQFEDWRNDADDILHWVQTTLPNNQWERYGAIAINEQTAYRQPGNSHTSRQAAAELRYAELTGNASGKAVAIRRLNWATYMVDTDGKNFYPRDDVWLTDGYGDYVRHYLRAMAAAPELAPVDQDHILRSSSVVTQVRYTATSLRYRTYDNAATETIRMAVPPQRVWVGDPEQPSKGRALSQNQQAVEGWSWASLAVGGVLTVRHTTDGRVNVEK